MNESLKSESYCPPPGLSPTPDEWLKIQHSQQARQVSDRAMGERALSAMEMHHIEKKQAEELQMYVRSFIAFPTVENFQRIQEASTRYITAWMNGRRRIID